MKDVRADTKQRRAWNRFGRRGTTTDQVLTQDPVTVSLEGECQRRFSMAAGCRDDYRAGFDLDRCGVQRDVTSRQEAEDHRHSVKTLLAKQRITIGGDDDTALREVDAKRASVGGPVFVTGGHAPELRVCWQNRSLERPFA